MNVSSRKLAAVLAERIGSIVPSGLSLRSEESNIEVRSGGQVLGGSAALEIIGDEDGRSLSERIETAARSALSAIQDVIIETTHRPWPGQPSADSALPQPDCRIAGDHLLVWFGDEATPVVSIAPIALGADVSRDA